MALFLLILAVVTAKKSSGSRKSTQNYGKYFSKSKYDNSKYSKGGGK